ncbi:MAG TPA: rhomboid family intramembrane serine protease [Balneolaceae bacterium]
MAKNKFLNDLKAAKVSIGIIIFLIISFFVFAFFPAETMVALLAIDTETVFSFSGFYQLFTYWIMQISLSNLLMISLSIILAGAIIERVLSKKEMILLIAVSIILGGVLFANLSKYAGLLLGASTLSWAYAGSAMIIVFRTWKKAPLSAKIIACFFSIGFFLLIFELFLLANPAQKPLAIANIACSLWGIGYSFQKMNDNLPWSEENESLAIPDTATE